MILNLHGKQGSRTVLAKEGNLGQAIGNNSNNAFNTQNIYKLQYSLLFVETKRIITINSDIFNENASLKRT